MQKDLEHIKNRFLRESSFTKFFYKDDVIIYLDHDFLNGDITILLSEKGGSHYMGKLCFSARGKLRDSYILTDRDLPDLLKAMEDLWNKKKYEQITIPREEFMQLV